ncbi:hypothetical protein F5B17DRAFT_22576 [Nemania serpens]|nr:hypothetical protein F5B17DRAFT_22576 [Nemania serpens]
MAVPGTAQALIAAFFFGILFNAASAALVLYVKGHGSAIYRDGLRLVLILLLFASSSWAFVEFLATLIDPSAASTCQVAVVFSSLFDQSGRVFAEQYLVWAVPKGDVKTPLSLVPQILVFGRLFVGIAFTAVTRTQFKPTCAPVSSVRAVSITTITLDAVIIGLLSIQAFASGQAKTSAGSHSVTPNTQTVRLALVGVAVWWATSVTSLLGLESIDLFYRTALPGIGLTILVALVTILSQTLAVPRELPRQPDSPGPRGVRDLSTSGSVDYPPSRYEDLKNANTVSISAFATRTGAVRSIRRNEDGTLPEISKPILNENETVQNSFKKIPTMELTEAASSDRLRRERYAQRFPALVAQRPAPRPPSQSMALNPVVTEPQIAGELERSESTKTTNTSGGLSVQGNASSTATLLSPGVDAVRRRSPRQPEPVSFAASFKVIRPGEPIRISIPRPPEWNQDLPPSKMEPKKTPLQRRPTTGLPSNPRTQALRSFEEESSQQKTPAVMFVSSIAYKNPDVIGDIIQGVVKVQQSPDSSDSVVNRPRPIPRTGDHQHRRTKSGGSIMSRKSILQLVAGSPTGLPSLPPIPPIPSAIFRAVPNGTLSMTVEEKMDFFYATPLTVPSSTEPGTKRRSSVPNLPAPQVGLEGEHLQPLGESLLYPESSCAVEESRTSKKTTAQTSALLGITMRSQSVSEGNESAPFSNNGYPVEELGSSWLPGISHNQRGENLIESGEAKRRSSPVLPPSRQMSMSTLRSEAPSGDEETITNWGSVHSPIAPVSRQNARSTYILKGSRNGSEPEAIPIVILDEPLEATKRSGLSSHSESDKSSPSHSDVFENSAAQFHHRPGDGCPTFSSRKNNQRPRKMPPPTPLLLNRRTAQYAIVVQPAEPSPVESPQTAYEIIEAQLRKFEQLNRYSMESPDQRLANLEQEMSQLESKWQSNHGHLRPDSISGIPTSPFGNLRPASQLSSIASATAEHRASHMVNMQGRDGEEALAPSCENSPQKSENIRSVSWQAKYPEAHLQYRENAPELLVKHNDLCYLSISKAGLGSPSPPPTDESESEAESDENRGNSGLSATQSAAIHGLWSQKAPAQMSSKTWLWTPRIRLSSEHLSCELPGLSVRSATRKNMSQLTIESSRLWQSSSKPASMEPEVGLWTGLPSQRRALVKAVARPVTIRPPRKNKRVTLLPDIIENPEPLPDKRGTLGIFQFPWGEKSEHATPQYRPSQIFMAMPGTMTTGRPMADARIIQIEPTEYSSSFFDEYDDEDGDNFSDLYDSGDDDFDETTLWEIASLLQTDKVPSRDSLFPMSWQSSPSIGAPALPEDITDMLSDDEDGSSDSIRTSTLLVHTGAAEEQIIPGNFPQPLLWTPPQAPRDHQTFGLHQHESMGWKESTAVPYYRMRARPVAEDVMPTQSNRLWSPMIEEAGHPKKTLLWAASKDTKELPATVDSIKPVQLQHEAQGLWSLPGCATGSTSQQPAAFRLPEPEARIWQSLVAQNSVVNKPRSRPRLPLSGIYSSRLWSQSKATEPVGLWAQPLPPLVCENSGLFRPGSSRTDYRTTSSPPAALCLHKRAVRRDNHALEPLTSTALWSSKAPIAITSSTTGLWEPNIDMIKLATPRPMPTSAAKDIPLRGLWKQPVEVVFPMPSGLFDPKSVRHDFRRTSKQLAVKSASKRRRFAREETSVLNSHSLWVSPRLQTIVAVKEEKIGFLWQANRLGAAVHQPVFFGALEHPVLADHRTSGKSCSENAHLGTEESMMRHTEPLVSPIASSLWTKPLELPATIVNGLWAISSKLDSSLDLVPRPTQSDDSANYYPMRGNRITHPSASDRNEGFVEQGLWKRGSGSRTSRHPSLLQKNWLDDSFEKSA